MTRLYARRGVLLGGYRTLGSFDKCPFRFWLAVNVVNVSQRSTFNVNRSFVEPARASIIGPAWQAARRLPSLRYPL